MIAQLLEVLIGLTLTYLIFSTIASALVEIVEMVVQKRGKFLEEGIRQILGAVSNRLDAEDMKTFYESPFISSLFRDDYKPGDRKLPSYIPAGRFADAVLQLDRADEPTFKLFAERMRQVLGPGAENDIEALKAQCIRYFDESMARVSGWYQRYARWWLIGIGFLIATCGNLDTLQIMNTLSQDDALRQRVVEEATRQSNEALGMGFAGTLDQQRKQVDDQLKLVDRLGLPIGWKQPDVCEVFRWTCSSSESPTGDGSVLGFLVHAPFWSKLFGILLTTFALTFGAPFWFDLLNQLVSFRTSAKPKKTEPGGTKPAAAEEERS